jgi:hypothetical protein
VLQVDRYLVASQFVELVKHGLVGTVGTTVEQLREIVTSRARAGFSAVIGRERSWETPKERQRRGRSRGTKKASKSQIRIDGEAPLFDLPPTNESG